ncbi:sel1 repeat family protein [Streptomyces californicus]|uniref:sel1 repeat family protein n=1 Tax=Streptomyces californicus TaxID=67351 RepID=UPI003791A8AF
MDDELTVLAQTLLRGLDRGDPDLYELAMDALTGTANSFHLLRLERLRESVGRLGPEAERRHRESAVLELLRETRRTSPRVYEELKEIADAFGDDEGARTSSRPSRQPRVPAPDAAANRNDVSGGVFEGPVVQASTFNGGVYTYYGASQHTGLPPVADWPRLDKAEPTAFGVRPTRRSAGEEALPPYVARDGDALLEKRMRAAAEAGGLVLVTGEPLSGKSRTAWVGMLANLPGTTRLFAPAAGTDLRGLPVVLRGRGEEPCVIWLDELEGHLGEHGLTPALLADLARLRVPVIATMSDEAYDAHRFGGQARARVLVGVGPVELTRVWTEAELERLAGALGEDRRLGDASLGCEEADIAAFLAVGPELWEEWWRARRPHAHPHGHLLVRVAMDLARCGTRDVPVPSSVLRAACALYDEGAARTSGESFEDAVAWASKARHGVAGMLLRGPESDTWRVFPSLYRDEAARPDAPPVPLGLWLGAMEAVRGDQDFQAGVVENARNALEGEADGRPEVGLVLGRLHEATGQDQDAEKWFRHSADAGGAEAAGIVGEALAERGDTVEAVPYLERAAEAGDQYAQVLLVEVLVDRAVSWLDRLAEDGSREAAGYAGRLREARGALPDTVEE